MSDDKAYPTVRCSGPHPDTMLVDVMGDDGAIEHACPDCALAAGVELVCIDVVRQLHERSKAS